MAFFAKDPRASFLLGAGERVSGQDVRDANVVAASSIANVVKSSLGPTGLDKMMVDEMGVSRLCCFLPGTLAIIVALTFISFLPGCHNIQRRRYDPSVARG
jgi:hypothetical protein